jgi:hypothetical protein
MRDTYFYVLLDANSDVFYVGLTTQDPKTRYNQHMREAREGVNSEKCARIRQCWELGSPVGFDIIETIPADQYEKRFEIEAEWIAYYSEALGYPLANIVSMPTISDDLLAQAYEIANRVQQLPVLVELRALIVAYDYDIDPNDNLMIMHNNLVGAIAVLINRGLELDEIIHDCNANYWTYTQAGEEIQKIINDRIQRRL